MATGDPRQLSLFEPDSAGSAPPAPSAGRPDPSAPADRTPSHPPAATEPPGYTRRDIHLDGEPLGYAVRRSRRRTIGLTIRDARLLIQAPSWASQHQIEDVIRKKSAWISEKLKLSRERLEILSLQDTRWRAGGRIPYLGVMIELHLDSTREAHFDGDPRMPGADNRLSLPLPVAADSLRIQERAQAWLQEQARHEFGPRLQHCLARAGQSIQGWTLSAAQGRWGSCTARRHIRLNWRLIHLPAPLIDYVVAHEVAHLKEMNHGPAFWREVERLYPDFKQARDALARHHPASLPLF